jgi:thymidylate synthase
MAVGDSQSIFLTDPPCLRGIDTRIRYGKLCFFTYFRSWDLWAGFPSNLAAIQLLKEYMASEIGVHDGELIALSKGLHLYEYSWELAKTAARVV